jgi:hypothetical protein
VLLDELLEEVKKDALDEQVRKICDKITLEEIGDKEAQKLYSGPRGPNIFLSLKCTEIDKNEIFVCLEREQSQIYIVSEWRRSLKKKGSPLKRVSVSTIGNVKKAKSILKVYATKYKFVKGE